MRYFRRILPFLIVGIFLVVFAVVRLYNQSSTRFHKAEELRGSGQMADAVEYYEWTIQGYFPWNPYVPRALAALESMADRSLKEHQTHQARQALQAIVSGLSVIEHLRQPFPSQYRQAREKLKQLETRMREQATLSPATNQPGASAATPAAE